MVKRKYSQQELAAIRRAALLAGCPTLDKATGIAKMHMEPPVGYKFEPWLKPLKKGKKA